MTPGDTIERSAWVTGEETPAQLQAYKERIVEAIQELCDYHDVLAGEVEWTELKPGDERVPPVPDHIQGWDVTLLVAHATVLGPKPKAHSFLSELEYKDLQTLRRITRNTMYKQLGRYLDNEECDYIIEGIGPDAAMDAVRKETVH